METGSHFFNFEGVDILKRKHFSLLGGESMYSESDPRLSCDNFLELLLLLRSFKHSSAL